MLILKNKYIKKRMKKILHTNEKKVNFNKLQICGNNGSGKTTLLDEIWNKQKEYLVESCSYVNQKFMLVEELTIEDNLKLLTSEAKEVWRLYSKRFPEINEDQKVIKLSGGQKQVLNFLIAFINDKQIILVDEPFNNLDESNRMYIEKLLSESEKKIIVVAHGYDFDWCDTKLEIVSGELREKNEIDTTTL